MLYLEEGTTNILTPSVRSCRPEERAGGPAPLGQGLLRPLPPLLLQPDAGLSSPASRGPAGGECFASSLAVRLIGKRVISPGAGMI